MQSKLFLTGSSGLGKTEMIKNTLGKSFAFAGGYITKRVTNKNGATIGYDLLSPTAISEISYCPASRFLDYTCTPPKVNTEVFRKDGVRLLREAEYYPFSVIDELGGFELLIPEFRAALSDFLSSPCPCIGVFKGLIECENLRRSLGLTDRFFTCRQQILSAMKNFDDIRIIEITGKNDEAAMLAVRDWCKEFAE